MTKEYSVLLLYPDYLTNSFGSETYYAFVRGGSPEEAVAHAREMAAYANSDNEPETVRPDDFEVLLVIRGHHMAEEVR